MRRFVTPFVAACVALVPLAAPDPSYADPPRSLVVHGRGWGHGRGMGQWGARAMAERGHSWGDILDHYYRNVRLTRARSSPTLRVLLATRRRATVTSARAFDVSWWGGKRIGRARAGELWRARRAGERTFVERKRDGTWRGVRSANRAVAFDARGAMLEIVTRRGVRAYRGQIVARGAGAKRVMVINRVRMEAYLRGVVPREVPALWHRNVLRAQAVAARTYAARVARASRARGSRYDICASARCQVYGGAAMRARRGADLVRLEHRRTDLAVRVTRRTMLLRRGAPILAEYSSSSGGWTAPGATRSVPDGWDRISPYHSWRVRLGVDEVTARWPKIGRLRRVVVTERSGRPRGGGRVVRLALVGSNRTTAMSGDAFRIAMGLRSNWFDVRGSHSGRYVFTFNFGYGTRHAAVRHLQRRLRAGGYFPRKTPATGYFGDITRASVRRYQRAHDIPTTGFVGPRTRARLNR